MNKAVENINDAEKLKEIILSLEKSYDSEIKILKEQISNLQDRLFGRKTEKIQIGFPQLSLFDILEPDLPILEEPKVTIASHKRKKRGRKPLPDNLPRIDVEHDLTKEEKQCQCGCIKSRIGKEVSEQLDIIPARMQVIRNIRYKYACKHCEGVEDDGPTISIARMPDQIIPKSIATSGLIAHVMTAKFVDALPFYRQEKQFARMGIEIPRATMCNWAMKVSDACEIIQGMLKDEILKSSVINIDETTIQVLKEPGRSKSYMWLFKGGPPEAPVILYQYHPSRSGDVPALFLKNYKGIVQTDGYAGYGFLDSIKEIIHAGCWAHVRRKFTDVIKASGKKNPAGNAGTALKYISKLYKIEKDARENNFNHEGLYSVRQEISLPTIKEFKIWLDSRVEKVPPKSLLGKAINYTLGQWRRLIPYLEDGHIPIDNNTAENAIRPFVIGRKNWLFNCTPEGARASATLYSLIETAKANRLEPYWYLRHLLKNLPEAMTSEEFKNLLPMYVDKTKLNIPEYK